MSILSKKFEWSEHKISISRRIVQITAFIFINYIIIELIFRVNLISFEGIIKILPILNSPRNPLSNGAGFAEYIFYSISEGIFPYFLIAVFLLINLFSGRIFCGWICPIGTIQDGISAYMVYKKKNKMVTLKTHKSLLNIKFVIIIFLGILIVPLAVARETNILFYFDLRENLGVLGQKPVSYFSLSEYIFVTFPNTILEIWEVGGIGPLFESYLFLFLFWFYFILLIVTIWYPRVYCRYFCPYGAICSVVSDYSFLKLSRSPVKCVGRAECGECERVCPKQIRILDEPFESFTGKGECNLCLKCKEVCKKMGYDAINYKFG